MELVLFVYLAGVVSSIGVFFGVLTALSLSLFIVWIFMLFAENRIHNLKKRYILVPVFCSLIASLTPSEKTMYLMLAGYASQQVLQSDTGEKLKKVIDARLDDYLTDIERKAKGERK